MKSKKLWALILVVAMAVSLTACGGNNDDTNTGDTKQEDSNDNAGSSDTTTTSKGDGSYELALVTDVGTIDDKSFNQGSWEGLKEYAEENDVSYKYYQPTEKTTSAYIEGIELAIEGGAKVVVCPGFLFEEAVFEAQEKYPDVNFIIIDGQPHDGNEDMDERVYKTADNTYAVFFAEEQAGYLAGYAAVKDGYTDLGFMGGMAVPAVIRFGYGYVQGVDTAAQEMNVDAKVRYHYTGGFDATPEAQAMAASWYQDGTEVIFACGGAVGNSAMSAAESAGKSVIGVDVDQSSESDTVITSAMKLLSKAVYDGIDDMYKGEFPGGETVSLDASEEGVGLPMDVSKFKSFSQDDYDEVYEKLASGKVELKTDTDINDPTEIKVSNTTVTLIQE